MAYIGEVSGGWLFSCGSVDDLLQEPQGAQAAHQALQQALQRLRGHPGTPPFPITHPQVGKSYITISDKKYHKESKISLKDTKGKVVAVLKAKISSKYKLNQSLPSQDYRLHLGFSDIEGKKGSILNTNRS